MKQIRQHWFQVLTALALVCLAVDRSRAQEAEPTNSSEPAPVATNVPAPDAPVTTKGMRYHRDDVVEIGHDAELQSDEEAKDVVAVFGSVKILGHATGNVVAVGGDVDLQGSADGDVVAVFGNVHAASNAVAGGNVVSVGGEVVRESGAKLFGAVQHTAITLPYMGNMAWFSKWLSVCVARLRPLSLQVGWVWPVAGTFFLLYLLIAAAFPQAVRPCVEALHTRPMTTLAVGIFGQLGILIVSALLAITVIGLPVIPFLLVAVVVAFIVGKVAIFERIGCGVGESVGLKALQQPILGFVLGAAIITLLYTVPILGFLTFLFISAWGFGAATTAAFVRLRGEVPPKPPIRPAAPGPMAPGPAAPPAFTMPVAGAVMSAAPAPPINHGDPVTAGAPLDPTIPPVPTGAIPPLPNVPALTALAYPRGGFWVRMGAGFLDCVLVTLVSNHEGVGLFFLVAVAYFAAMLAWKGTSVGGIILRLQVVRTNGERLNFLVALVRALAAVFSCVCLFLGFFWIGWDYEKQGWHDKIAGTVVVRLPHAPSLVCI
jgi:uncharacterized RDD family membrane protein YckC